MLKYSDVLSDTVLGKGTASPKNFHSQLLRCAGDIPTNVFASINNRFTLDKVNGPDQQQLEREFLSPSIASKIAKARKERGGEPDSVVFNRVGALLMLKLLLGTHLPKSPFRATALGACALHVNDYLESMDTSALQHGLLPVVTEFAPIFELQNPPEIGPVLRRFYFIYRTLLQRDQRMRALIREELNVDVNEVTFSGLPFDSYFALLFGIYAVTAAGVQAKPFPTSILDFKDVAEKAGISMNDLGSFVSERAMTVSHGYEKLGPLDDVVAFRKAVTDSNWASDFRLFRNRPLLALDDGRMLVVDLQFLFENASRGLYWGLRSKLSEPGTKKFMAYWGGLFERYVQMLIAHYYPEVRLNVHHKTGEIDVLLSQGENVFLIEVKSGFLSQDAKGSRDQSTFAKAVEQKFVGAAKKTAGGPGKKSPKGVAQLANAVAAVRAGEIEGVDPSAQLYPVLIGEDPVLQTFAMNAYLNGIFTEKISSGSTTSKPLTVVVVDEIEHVLPYVAAGDLSLGELFDGRFEESSQRVVAIPLNTTFYDWAIVHRPMERPETFLQAQGDELVGIIDEHFKSLR